MLNHAKAILQAGHDPQKYATTMTDLGSHHARDNHSWGEGGTSKCSWHDPLRDDGTPYHTTHPLKCAFHIRAYEVECMVRAAKACRVIHPVLGKGHNHLPEAAHHVALTFGQKDNNLNRLNYMVRTNLGLLQSNLSMMTARKGPSYHWFLDLF